MPVRDAARAAAGRPRIVHVSGDFPDPWEPHKTAVIRHLLDLTADRFAHRVYSLNRRMPPLGRFAGRVLRAPGRPELRVTTQPFAAGEALVYEAPARGLYHAGMLEQLGAWLARALAEAPPDLIVGHKLTIEGIAVAHAAAALGVPYALSLQGDTELKVLAGRPDLRPLLARVFHGATMVFPFAPWTLRAVEAKLGERAGPSVMLPCPTELDTPVAPTIGGGLVSLFHLASHRRKNLDGMAHAVRLLAARGEPASLTIAGGGSEAERRACQRTIDSTSQIRLIGPLDREQVPAALNEAAGFVMPSRRESFGLVFIEALFAGTPIIYPAGQGVSGYFDGAPFAIAVDPRNPAAIAEAMLHVIHNEAALKAALAEWQASPAAERFRRPAIASTFAAGLETALGRAAR